MKISQSLAAGADRARPRDGANRARLRRISGAADPSAAAVSRRRRGRYRRPRDGGADGGRLGKPILIENKSGAGGIVATDAVAKSAPDGYTILLTTPNHTINAALQPKLPYDTEKDLVPISVIATVPEVLVSQPERAVQNVSGVRRLRQAESGQAQLCFRRRRHAAAFDHGAAAATRRRQGDACPLPRRGAGHDRPARQCRAAQARHLRDLASAGRRRRLCACWASPAATAPS